MPGGPDHDDSDDVAPKLSLRHRLLLSLPHLKRDQDRAPLGERLRSAIVKPAEPGTTAKTKADGPNSVEELEDAVRYADDKERLTGLLLAPVAAIIGFIVIGSLITDDPAGSKHVSVSLYHSLFFVLLGLSVVMLATAYFRKRLYLGIVMALYGLSVFNLHYWGFGVPFVLVGAWLLVRAYRLQRDLKEATGDGPSRPGRRSGTTPRASGAQPNKRYTPRTAPRKRLPPKPDNQKKAG
ncbi:MAG: hypothetical protein ABSC30_16990 [Acidimicrobiales bacterium]|jgi:hypothetical protein